MLRIICLFALLAVAAGAALEKCPAGKAGKNCELEDPCAAPGNPCKNGQICQGLDAEFKPVCACPAGMKGSNCTERDCPIVSFHGKGFLGALNFDSVGQAHTEKLNQLAVDCKVVVNVTKSFTRSTSVADEVDDKDLDLFVGHGFRFELLNEHGNATLCDTKCLGAKPVAKSPVECFLGKLGQVYNSSNPGVLRSRAFSYKNDSALLAARQIGCELRKDLPQEPVHKLVGAWRLVDSENWSEFLDANNIGYWTKLIVKGIKPNVYITNSGKNWTISVKSTFSNMLFEFKEGTKWESKTPITGERSEHTAFSDSKESLVEDQTIFSEPPRKVHIVREVGKDGRFVQTMTLKNVVCKRIYERIKE